MSGCETAPARLARAVSAICQQLIAQAEEVALGKCVDRFGARRLSSLVLPVFKAQTGNPRKLGDVPGHQAQPGSSCNGCDLEVVRTDRSALARQLRTNLPTMFGSAIIEGQTGHMGYQFAQASLILGHTLTVAGAEPQLRPYWRAQVKRRDSHAANSLDDLHVIFQKRNPDICVQQISAHSRTSRGVSSPRPDWPTQSGKSSPKLPAKR